MTVGRTLSRGLGAFSLGLGAVQLVAPRRLLRATGYPPRGSSPLVMRVIGLRELGAAGGLLVQRWPVPFAWMRVAGDAMDLALAGRGLRARDVHRSRAMATFGALVAVTAADLATGVLITREAPAQKDGSLGGAKPVRKSITVNRPREEVYAFWRDLTHLPQFMHHLEDVTDLGNGRSHWTAKGPANTRASWDAELTEDRPNERIAWRSVPGSGIQNSGSVEFVDAPGDRGTEVRVELAYEPPAGPLGIAAAKLFGEEPEQQVSGDLRRLKQVLETGEVAQSEAVAGGRTIRQRPAQPLDAGEAQQVGATSNGHDGRSSARTDGTTPVAETRASDGSTGQPEAVTAG
jgi:uncharacterized membrane protein